MRFPSKDYMWEFFEAIRLVETGGEADPTEAVGRDGEIGPYQITRAYFEDSGVPGVYENVCKSYSGSRVVMMYYWKRYSDSNVSTYEKMARQHNGGPTGHLKKATNNYWERVERIMQTLIQEGEE